MKREIKFRAWLKAESKMCTIDLLRFDTGAFLIGAEPAADQIIVNMKLKVKALDNGRFCNNGEFELMQFTGLKDKKGVEIYEGDIVTDNHWIGEVVYKNTIVDDYDEYPSKSVSGFYIEVDNGDYLIDDFNGYEIIGNIYEDMN